MLKVGDKVKIINVKECHYSYNTTMLDLEGQTATIIDKRNDTRGKVALYRIDKDKGVNMWCDKTLIAVENLNNEDNLIIIKFNNKEISCTSVEDAIQIIKECN